MAIIKVAQFSSTPTAVSDYEAQNAHLMAFINQINSQAFILTNPTGTTEPTIKQDTYINHGGTLYTVDTADESITGTPADGNVYIKLSVSGSNLVASYVTDISAFTWSQVYGYLSNGTDIILPYMLVKSGTSWTKYRMDIKTPQYVTDQNLRTTDSPTFASINTGLGNFEIGQNLRTTDNPTFASINTGHGANELYAMNQNVRTTDMHTIGGVTPIIYVNPDILSSFSSPGALPRGLTFDGTNLISCDNDTDRIYIHSGISATISSSFASPGTYPSGLTFDGTNLISCDPSSGMIYIHSGISATISSSFASPSDDTSDLTFDGTNLISCDSTTDMIYVHSGVSSTISSSFASPGTLPSGLAFDDTNLISCDSDTDMIYVHDGISSTILSSFSSPGTGITSLTFDGTNLISCDSDADRIYRHKKEIRWVG